MTADIAPEEQNKNILVDGVMTGVAVLTTEAVRMFRDSMIGFQPAWTGTPTGVFLVEVSLDQVAWTDLGLAGLPAPAGGAGNGWIEVPAAVGSYYRLKYTNATSTGVLNVPCKTKRA